MKIFARIFFFFGVPAGILAGLLYTPGSLSERMAFGWYAGLSSGFLMAVVLGTVHKCATRKMAGDVSPKQIRIVTFHSHIEDLLNHCKTILEAINANVTAIDKDIGTIRATTGLTWKSWGEHIDIDMLETNGKIEIHISSRPRMRMAITDYGKGYENVEKISSELAAFTG